MFGTQAALAPQRARGTPSESAIFLVEEGQRREQEGNDLAALRRFEEAIAMDASSEPAYAALGALRARRREYGEAVDVYSVCIARLPGSVACWFGRGRARQQLSLRTAIVDLRRAHELLGNDGSASEEAIVREEIAWAREQGAVAEIGPWRRLLQIGRQRPDAKLVQEAFAHVLALQLYLGDLDPVIGGARIRDPIRSALARAARKP